MKHQTETLCAFLLIVLAGAAVGFEANPVDPIGNLQQTPDVDDGKVVWAEDYSGSWDVYGYDLFDPSVGFFVVDDLSGSDQIAPAIWNERVVYQDNSYGDWDVYMMEISDANYLLTPSEEFYLNDQIAPVIHGNTVVWQSYVVVDDGQGGTIEDWGVFAADMIDPNVPFVYLVDDYIDNQQVPSVYRNQVVYQDDVEGNWNILSADIWLNNSPQYRNVIAEQTGPDQENPIIWDDIVVCQVDSGGGDYDILAVDISMPDTPEVKTVASGPSVQINPDISGHLIVWQDDRNGNWDIYGYNLITREEFLITTETAVLTTAHPADQTNPAISGSLVVWEDSRDTPANIYYAVVDGDVIADCPNPPAGDIDGDCRVTLTDVGLLAADWLGCGLSPASACGS